jgi:hypothetical protein
MVNWRKSTYSDGNGGQCVEAADTPGAVLVRDTNNNGAGPELRFDPGAWRTFTARLRA